MRAIFTLLILAVCFSGYSAAAHAFADEGCSTKIESAAGVDKADCTHHAKKSENSDKTQKSACMECLHCCAGHVVASFSDQHIKIAMPENILASLPLQALKSQDFSSLLRPPQNLA